MSSLAHETENEWGEGNVNESKILAEQLGSVFWWCPLSTVAEM